MWRVTMDIYSTYEHAEAAHVESKFSGTVSENNVMRVLVKANQTLDPPDRLSEDEVKGQINTLVSAANITTSRAISRILDELANHPEVQDRVRTEIQEAKVSHGGALLFDTLDTLPVLDAVVRETLRRFPPLAHIARICLKDTVLPLAHPITGCDGATISEIIVPAGTDVYVGMLAANNDYCTWGPDAREWKPDRWLSELPQSVTDAHMPGVYAHQMTFVAGNRSCIGVKFALIEIKVVLSALLARFRFSPGAHHVDWVSSHVYQPIINNEKTPRLPLRVELLPEHVEQPSSLETS